MVKFCNYVTFLSWFADVNPKHGVFLYRDYCRYYIWINCFLSWVSYDKLYLSIILSCIISQVFLLPLVLFEKVDFIAVFQKQTSIVCGLVCIFYHSPFCIIYSLSFICCSIVKFILVLCTFIWMLEYFIPQCQILFLPFLIV